MIEVSQCYTHKREGYMITVVECDTLVMKEANDASWHDAVVYTRDNDTDEPPTRFVRAVSDFENKFTQCEDM